MFNAVTVPSANNYRLAMLHQKYYPPLYYFVQKNQCGSAIKQPNDLKCSHVIFIFLEKCFYLFQPFNHGHKGIHCLGTTYGLFSIKQKIGHAIYLTRMGIVFILPDLVCKS